MKSGKTLLQDVFKANEDTSKAKVKAHASDELHCLLANWMAKQGQPFVITEDNIHSKIIDIMMLKEEIFPSKQTEKCKKCFTAR